ncbi:MAG TPA: hypothetical protein VHV47_04255 [Opitutaceae bacterium]|nr:hypothetical protein [Opitutaceae bacterium]
MRFSEYIRRYREETADGLLLAASLTLGLAAGMPAGGAGLALLLGLVLPTNGRRHPRQGWGAVAARLPAIAGVAVGAALLFRFWLHLGWAALAFAPAWAALESGYRAGWLPFRPKPAPGSGGFVPQLRALLLAPPARPLALRRRDWAALALGIAVTAGAYSWTLRTVNPSLASRDPLGLYGYMTDALLSRQLSFKVPPDPRLLALANPYAGTQGVPRLHDASLYQGRYYMYFGVAPIVLLLAPWRLLTGTFLADGGAIVIFAFGGFLIATALWAAARRRYFPGLPARWLGAGVLMLGLGNYLFFLIQSPAVYQVPISCAYACLMAALAFAAAALGTDDFRRQSRRLAGAGLAWALAVGARPDYLLSLPALAVPVAALWLRAGWTAGFRARDCRRLVLWSAAPVAAVGAALAAYNWGRFGSVFETGIKYQLASMDERGVALIRLAYLPAGLRAYLLAAPDYTLSFPFVSLPGRTFGLLPCAPFALAALGFPLACALPALRQDRVWVLAVGAALLAALCNFCTVCSYWFLQERYALDFLPAAIGVGLLVAGVAWDALRRRPALRRLAMTGALAAGMATLGQSVLLSLGGHLPALRPLAAALDAPIGAAERLLGLRPGPIEMTVQLPVVPSGRNEPLVSADSGADVLYLRQSDSRHVQFGLFHRGSGGPLGEPQAVDPDRSHVIAVDLGALYPSAQDSAFGGWPAEAVEALQRRALVRLDGRIALEASALFYPNDPLHTSVGRNPDPADVSLPAFRGRILAVVRRGLPKLGEVTPGWGGGPVRLHVQLPEFRDIYSEPLVSTGRRDEGDLAYITYLAPGKVRFGHDSKQYGLVESEAVACDPNAEQTIDIDMASLERPDPPDGPDGRTRFQLRFNGRLMLSAPRPFHPAPPVATAFGFNAAGSTAAAPTFTGPRLRAEPLVRFAGPAPAAAGDAVRLWLRFPADRAGYIEPLLASGRPGAYDLVYVVYEAGARLRLGYEHAGSARRESPSLQVEPFVQHELVIATGPRFSVAMDGLAVLAAPVPPFPAAPEAVYAALNAVGAPSCQRDFTGQLQIEEPAAAGP